MDRRDSRDYGGYVPRQEAAAQRVARISLAVIPKPESDTRSLLVRPPGDLTPFKHALLRKSPVMECGSCGEALTIGVTVCQLGNLVFKCPRCGSYNQTVEG